MAEHLSKARPIYLILVSTLIVILWGRTFANLFVLDKNGLSSLTRDLPYLDFTNLWAGGKMAWQGHLHALFNVDQYRAWLRAELNPHLANEVWSYPPSILLLGVPLSLLPIGAAYALWQAFSFLTLFIATRYLKLPLIGRVAILVSMPALLSVMLGQNGLLTGALLISSLSLLERRPIVSGVLIGLLTMKPQLGVLLPFCLIAGRKYRTFAAATATAIVLALLTGLLFGFGVWAEFWNKTVPLMTGVMNASFSTNAYGQGSLDTVFASLRALGMNLHAAQTVQFLIFALSVLMCLYMWRPGARIDPIERVCFTGVLTLLALPYAHDYDWVPVSTALIYLYFNRRAVPAYLSLLGLLMLFPLTILRKHGYHFDPLLLVYLTGYLFLGQRTTSERQLGLTLNRESRSVDCPADHAE